MNELDNYELASELRKFADWVDAVIESDNYYIPSKLYDYLHLAADRLEALETTVRSDML